MDTTTPAVTTPPTPTPASGRSRRRRAVLLVLLLVLPFVAMELGVRVLIASGRLVEGSAHSADLDQRWREIQTGPVPDIIILGDSLAAQGIEPRVLADGVSVDGGADDARVTAASLTTPGGSFGLQADLVEMLDREGRLPKVFVLGISGYMPENSDESHQAFLRSRLGQLATGCGATTGPGDWLDCQAGVLSAAWRWHGQPDEILAAVKRSRRGRSRPDGFPEAKGVTVQAVEDRVQRALRLAEPTPVLNDAARTGFQELMAALRTADVPVVAVTVPFSPPYQAALEAREPGWEAARRAIIEQLEQMGTLDIVDPLSFGDWWGDGSSRDPRHLSSTGAAAFTRQLLDMPAFRDGLAAGLDGAPTR